MKKFRTAFFKGYQKEEVDEYIEFLVDEMESLKEETNRALEKEHGNLAQLQEKLEKEQKEKEALQEKMEQMQSAQSGFDAKDQELQDKDQKLHQLEEQLKKYEESYKAVSELYSMAKENAEKLVTQAQVDADTITSTAKAEALVYRKQAEEEIKKKSTEEGKQFMLAKYRLIEYLNSLKQTQSKLIETYNELGALVSKMPIRIDDLYSDDEFELLVDRHLEDSKREDDI